MTIFSKFYSAAGDVIQPQSLVRPRDAFRGTLPSTLPYPSLSHLPENKLFNIHNLIMALNNSVGAPDTSVLTSSIMTSLVMTNSIMTIITVAKNSG